MATTGTYTYNITGADLVTDAMRLLGAIEEGNTATPTQIADARPSFEMYIKSLSKYGLNLWTTKAQEITVVDGTGSYVPTIKIMRITDMVYRDSDGQDTIMIPLTREEYWNLNDKDQESQPTQYYYDPQDDQATSKIYVWPVPDTAAATATSYFEVVGQIQLEDAGSDATLIEEINVPQEWLETIKYGVATRIARMFAYPVQEYNILIKEYREMLKENLDFDTEQESIFLRPNYNRQVV